MAAPSPDTLKLVKDHGRPVVTFAVARDAAGRVYVGQSDFGVGRAETLDKFEVKELYKHGSYVTGVAVTAGGVVSGGYDGKLAWFDPVAGKTVRTIDAHAKWIRKVVASPDGKRVASVADDMLCKVWDAATGKLIHTLKGHADKTPHHYVSMLYACAFSADGKLLATADKVGHVVVWDAAAGTQLAAVEAPVMYTWDPTARRHSIGGVRSVAFSPDGKSLAVGGMGKVGNIDHLEGKARVEVFDWKAGTRTAEFPGDKFAGLVNKLQFAPDGSWLLAAGGGTEGFVMFFDPAKKKVLRQDKLNAFVHDFDLSPKADSLLLVGHNRVFAYGMG